MKSTFFSIVVAMVMAAAYSVPAYSQARPETLVKQRQAVMTLHGKYFYPIRNMSQGKTAYDTNVVARNAAYVEVLSKMPWDGFAASTKDVKSGATPAAFSDTAKFKEAADRYQAEATKLAELTKKGDEPSIRAQIMAVDKTCNSCHDNFREKQ